MKRLNEVIRVGSCYDRMDVLTRGNDTRACAYSAKGHSRAKRQRSPGTNLAGTLILDFPVSRTEKTNSRCVSLRYFVMAPERLGHPKVFYIS